MVVVVRSYWPQSLYCQMDKTGDCGRTQVCAAPEGNGRGRAALRHASGGYCNRCKPSARAEFCRLQNRLRRKGADRAVPALSMKKRGMLLCVACRNGSVSAKLCVKASREGVVSVFHDNLRLKRKERGLSQEELASRLHVVRQTISK